MVVKNKDECNKTDLPQINIMPFQEAYDGIERRVLFGRKNSLKIKLIKKFLTLFKPFMYSNYNYVKHKGDYFKHTDIREYGIRSHFRRFSLLMFNAFILLKKDSEVADPLECAATTISAALKIFIDYKEKGASVFNVECNSANFEQFSNLFGHAFSPKDQCLGIVNSFDSKHITIFVNGHAYKLDVFNNDLPVGYNHILSSLKEIIRLEESNNGEVLGPLTALKIKDYLKAVNSLKKLPDVNNSINQIEKSLFAVCLDLNTRINDRDELCRNMYSKNLGNRFFMLSTQIVVTADSDVGVVLSHPMGIDGQIMVLFGDKLYKTSKEINKETICVAEDTVHPQALPLKRIPDIERKVPAVIHEVPFIFEYNNFGKSTFKEANISPDSAIHLAIMIAVTRVFGKIPTLDQFVSMRHYKGGRLSRPQVTPKSLEELIDTIDNDGVNSQKTKNLLLRALNEHKQNVISAQQKGYPYEVLIIPGMDAKRGMGSYRNFAFFMIFQGILGISKSDIVTSHLKLPESVVLIGRPGIMGTLANMFSVHVVLREHQSIITFMPTKMSLSKTQLIKDEINMAVGTILSLSLGYRDAKLTKTN